MEKLQKIKLNERTKKWFKDKFDEGWRETCMGFLSPDDIKKSGMKFNKEMIQELGKWRPRGYCSIPCKAYIAEINEMGRQKGIKYTKVSYQFMEWLKEYNNRQYNKKSLNDLDNDEEVNVNEVIF